MGWIRFDRDERPAPSMPLQTASGEDVSVADYRGRASLVLIFSPDPSSGAARNLIESCSAGRREIEALGGELFVVARSAGPAANGADAGRTILDPSGELHRRYAKLLEFDTSGKLIVYILDEYGVPYAAWVGDEPDSRTVCFDIQRWLLYVSIQCPE